MKRLIGSNFRSAHILQSVVTRDASRLACLVFIGLAARLLHLHSQPFWLDEAITYQRIHLGLDALIADSFTNRHMPSYVLRLQAFARLAADDAWLRIPAAVFGTASVSMAFLIARRIAGRGAAVVAGLLIALSPLQERCGQEARSRGHHDRSEWTCAALIP